MHAASHKYESHPILLSLAGRSWKHGVDLKNTTDVFSACLFAVLILLKAGTISKSHPFPVSSGLDSTQVNSHATHAK